MSRAIDAVVVGATGYVGGELLRLIAAHPVFELRAPVSSSRAGDSVSDLFPGLGAAYPEDTFVAAEAALEPTPDGGRVALFSAAPHGASAGVVRTMLDAAASRSIEVHAVDVSADFRFPGADAFAAVYGRSHAAPELIDEFRCAVPEHLPGADRPHVGHPGCFATAVLLATVPLYDAGVAEPALYVSGITGSTGSGRTPSTGTHHPERHSNLYAYKPLAHRHVPEIAGLIAAATGRRPEVSFVPHSGPFARGIHVTAQGRLNREISAAALADLLSTYYGDSPFVRVVAGMPRVKDVVASNYCHLGAAVNGRSYVVTGAIDNLVKGAAGGAMQWMNRLWELREDAGLRAAPPAWT